MSSSDNTGPVTKASSKRIKIPLLFTTILAVVAMVVIFFGAWAVSADTGNSKMYVAVVRGEASILFDDFAYIEPELIETLPENNLARNNARGDTWWGEFLILACPLH